jgi:hypothetical protein
MRLNVKAVAAACGLLWGGAVLTTGIANLVSPRYGRDFLRVMSSVYPGYHARRSAGQLALLTGCALADGAGAGALYALLYNSISRCSREQQLARVA